MDIHILFSIRRHPLHSTTGGWLNCIAITNATMFQLKQQLVDDNQRYWLELKWLDGIPIIANSQHEEL